MKKINKKTLSIILACITLISIIALAACGSKKDAEKATEQTPATEEAVSTTEKKKDDTVKSIDLKTDKGELKYIEYLPFPKNALFDSDKDKDAVVFCFEYTNLSDEEKSAQSTFDISCYQNGVELDYVGGYTVTEDAAINALHSCSSSLLNGGKVKVGFSAVLSDKSPVTIIAKEFGFSDEVEKQKMIVSFDEKEDKTDDKADTSTAEKDKETSKEIKLNEKIETKNFDFTLKSAELTYDVSPKNPDSYYRHYEAEDGKIYLDLNGTYYNTGKTDDCIRDLPVFKAEYSDGYKYTGFTITEVDGDFDYASSYVACEPLTGCEYHCLIEMPEAVENSKEPLKVIVNFDGTEYIYNVR